MQDQTNSKIMTMAFVAAGFLAALIVQVLFENFSVTFAPVARLHANETVRHALPIGVGLLVFYCQLVMAFVVLHIPLQIDFAPDIKIDAVSKRVNLVKGLFSLTHDHFLPLQHLQKSFEEIQFPDLE
jgi:hypothetical protein